MFYVLPQMMSLYKVLKKMAKEYSITGLSVSNLVKQVFSLMQYELNEDTSESNRLAYNTLAELSKKTEGRYSDLGTYVEDAIVFKGQTYNKYDEGLIVQVQTDDFVLPYTSVIKFSRAKHVVKTHISGYCGSVKETFGADDWQIDIQGVILEQNNKSVSEIKQELLIYESLADTIKIKEGKAFTEKGIYGIFIEELSLPQLKAFPKVQPFEIRAVSDSLDLWLME